MSQDPRSFHVLPRLLVIVFALWCGLNSGGAHAGNDRQTSAVEDVSAKAGGFSRERALHWGERIYREGILPSGASLRAVVQGDIPVAGSMFSCESCHLRSGLGSLEGSVITLPTSSTRLYSPLVVPEGQRASGHVQEQDQYSSRLVELRPAYTDESLAIVLQQGIDPSGRELSATMPRYMLADTDMEIMIFYLKNLSASHSPGVTDTTIHLATIVSADAPAGERASMLSLLREFVRVKNVGSSYFLSPAGRTRVDGISPAYRQFRLSVWELKGPPQTWEEQLRAYYSADPPFAIIGGMTNGDWLPIHRFCELNRVPSLFPLTDLPALAEKDWYTLYFSKGLYQEGKAAAQYLASLPGGVNEAPMVQVFRDTPGGRALAESFAKASRENGMSEPHVRVFARDAAITPDAWEELARQFPHAVFLLWLDANDRSAVKTLSSAVKKPRTIFVSATLFGRALYDVPEETRPIILATFPYQIGSHGIPSADQLVSSRTYAALQVINPALVELQGNYYRDYLLDLIGMMPDQPSAGGAKRHSARGLLPMAAGPDMVMPYPRLSFGPGQRYASKGCYIVQIGEGPAPELIRKSDWITH